MRLKFLVLLAFLLIVIPPVLAEDVLRGDRCIVEEGRVLEGDLFALCRTLIVNGEVRGHLYAAAAAVQITGKVDGDVFLLSGQANVSGMLGGSLNVLGALLQVDEGARLSAPDGSLNSISLSTVIAPSSEIPGSITFAGYQLIMQGSIGRGINFWGTSLAIEGSVANDVAAVVGSEGSTGAPELLTIVQILAPNITSIQAGLTVGEDAHIGGVLRYSAPEAGTILAALQSEPQFTPIEPVVAVPPASDLPDVIAAWMGRFAVELVVALAFGLLLFLLASKFAVRSSDTLVEHPRSSFFMGLGAFAAVLPIALMILLVSIVLVMLLAAVRMGTLALIIGFVINLLNLGATSVFFFAAVFFARMIFAYAVGRWLLRGANQARWREQRRFIVPLFLGAVFVAFAVSLPSVGWLASMLTSIIGTGAVIKYADTRLRQPKLGVKPRLIYAENTTSVLIPPPITEDRHAAPGTDNLPDGFDWWA